MTQIPLIIDTDMAMDDWMAAAYLIRAPEVDLRAITIAATGEAHAGPGMRSALGLLALAGKRGVKVAAGRSLPLAGKNAFPWVVRFMMDRRLFLGLPAPLEAADRRPAVEVLAEVLGQAAQKVTIVALGPLTNLAELFERHPALVSRVERIYSMGGALHVPGNLAEMLPKTLNRHAEWNYYCDPAACARVFRSGVPITLVPLDATNQVPLTPAFTRQVQSARRTPLGSFLARLLGRISRLLGPARPFYLWDPLAAVAAVHPQIIETETLSVRMEETGLQQGSVFADPAGMPLQVALRVDRAAFEELYLETALN